MEIVGTPELSARISPCLRLFIETLFDEVDVKHGASWHQNHELQTALRKAMEKEEVFANEASSQLSHV